MKRIFTLFMAVTFGFYLNAQVNDAGTGFKLDFNVEDDSLSVAYSEDIFEGVTMEWWGSNFSIEDSTLKWEAGEEEGGLGLMFDPPLDLSGNAGISYDYKNIPDADWFVGLEDAGGNYEEIFPVNVWVVPGVDQWQSDDGNIVLGTGNSLDPSQFNGIWFFLAGATPGHTVYIDNIVFGDGTVNVNMHRKIEGFSIYPNPANEYVIFDGKAQKVSIFNSIGQVVLTRDNYQGEKISISDLKSGLYFINADNNTAKFIVE